MESATSTVIMGQNSVMGSRRGRKGGLLLIATAVIAIAAVGIVMSPGGGGGLGQGAGLVRTETGNPGAVGTSGQHAEGASQSSGPSVSGAGGVIHELETITGTNDGHELVGRRVEMHVPVSQHINDGAFWVGMGDNRLLVVLSRDTRDGQDRQRGGPSTTGISNLRAGQQATVSGSIQRVPYAEAMYSWGLTTADRAELMERRIYLKADTVTPGA
jgi:hypothetical protein